MAPRIHWSEITDRGLYLRRREFIKSAALATAAIGTGAAASSLAPRAADAANEPLSNVVPAPDRFRVDDEVTDRSDATTYNNFYEFGTGKTDPAENAGSLRTRPWSVAVEGEVGKPGLVPLEDLLRGHALEERVYRMRCVEAWSMVIPWVGIPLASILDRFEPTSRAKYVAFETLVDPAQMPGQRRRVIDWPYREGLRIDEARHPLTILAVGMYGAELPNQNGAPLRLVVPWKYGFKGIKSIVKIRLTSTEPATSWNMQAPDEYGFYANVNPEVDHPRWSQARERRIGEFLKRRTLPFNGYAEEVASLYKGMDLRKLY